MTSNVRIYLKLVPIVCAAVLTGCEVDDSMPTHPRTANFLTPDTNSQDNAEKRALEKPPTAVPAAGSEFPGRSDAGRNWNPTVVTLDATPAPVSAPPSNNPFNAILHELGYVGPPDWQAFGHTMGPMDVYNKDPYRNSLPHTPADPGSVPVPGGMPAPSGDWTVYNSWGQNAVLTNYPHRPWAEVTVDYLGGEVKHNPVYFFNVQDHLHVKQYEEQFNRDVETKNYQSQWFYLNAAGMPVWVLLEPPEVPYVSPRVQKVERHIPEQMRDDWKSDAYEIPWFFVQTATLPVLMALEPPFSQRITAIVSGDPNFLGHLPTDGTIVPVPTPGNLQWNYPFLNSDGTVKPATPTAAEPAPTPAP